MTELYLVFLALAIILFGGIVAYSMWRQRRVSTRDGKPGQSREQRRNNADPLMQGAAGSQSVSGLSSEGDSKEASDKASKFGSEPSLPEASAPQNVTDERARAMPSISAPSLTATDTEPHNGDAGSSQSLGQDLNDQAANGSQSSNASAPPAEQAKQEPTLPFSTLTEVDRQSESEPIEGELRFDSASNIITELVARVKNAEPLEQQALLQVFREHDYKFQRKVHLYGLNELTDVWQDIEFEQPSARFVELGVVIQLADSEGAMGSKELHDFQQMALGFTNAFNAPFEFSMDIDDAMQQAQLLDQIGRRYDSMAVLNVVPRSKAGFRMADIEGCARELNMYADKNGIFVKATGQKHALTVLYRLACTDGSGHFGVSRDAMTTVHDLVIYMNVPTTPEPDRVFEEMASDANSLASWLEGKVVGRNGKPMTQRSYTVLLQQISDIAYSMQNEGITAGDPVSKKLF